MKSVTKTYLATGQIRAKFKFNVGEGEDKKFVRLYFQGGEVGRKGFVPGKYTTNDEAIQKAIEKSGLFKNKGVTLLKKAGKKVVEEEPTLEAVKGITTIPKAIEYLEAQGVDVSKITNKISVMKAATVAGVYFSDLK
jgi:hypothetical protein